MGGVLISSGFPLKEVLDEFFMGTISLVLGRREYKETAAKTHQVFPIISLPLTKRVFQKNLSQHFEKLPELTS